MEQFIVDSLEWQKFWMSTKRKQLDSLYFKCSFFLYFHVIHILQLSFKKINFWDPYMPLGTQAPTEDSMFGHV